ncbi:MAG: hypothetical protein O2917_06400 [Acidobacteria bacterium]|nr:hypothetical protein [Acidobacteriota bacterium]
MTPHRVSRVATLIILAAIALTSGACASTKTINELLADPSRYTDRSVKVSGEVVDSYSVANRGVYRLNDGTGELWVVSETGVPRTTARVTVKGKVRDGFNLGSLITVLRLPPGVAAGLVLVASSHKAKR